MRRIFVYEYACAVATAAGVPLRAEGSAMLEAVLEDLARVPGIRPITLLSSDRPLELRAGERLRIDPTEEEPAFRRLAQQSDWSLIIAPEFDRILEDRCRWVAEAGGRLLGPSVEAVSLTSDKLALSRRWRECGAPTPATSLPARSLLTPSVEHPVVCKPRRGAGAQATFVARTALELERAVAQAHAERPGSEMIVQPFVRGMAASVAFLVGPSVAIPLVPVEQAVSGWARLRYRGGRLPLPPRLAERAERLGKRAVAAAPGLRGYVGVDLVLGPAEDGRDDWAIEINPRLTTSYIGLRRLACCNLADALLNIAEGNEIPPLSWREGRVAFTTDGGVRAE